MWSDVASHMNYWLAALLLLILMMTLLSRFSPLQTATTFSAFVLFYNALPLLLGPVETLRAEAEANGVELVLEVAPDCPSVFIDEGQDFHPAWWDCLNYCLLKNDDAGIGC